LFRNMADITYTAARWRTRHIVDILKYIVYCSNSNLKI